MLKLITLLLTSSMTVMAGATIAPALPQIQEHFSQSPNSEFWVKLLLTLPALLTAIGAPVAGAIIDQFGRKRLLAAAVALYGLAGGSGLVLNTLPGLLVGRALLGLSVGAIMTTSIALIADYFQGARRNQVMGLQAAFMGYGGVAFLTLGGFLAGIGWRMPFLIYLTAFVVLPLVIWALTEPARESSPQTAMPDHPNEPAPRIPTAAIALIYLVTFGMMVAFYMIPVQIPFYLRGFDGVSSTATGLAIAACTLASALVSMRYGSLKARFGFASILAMLFGLMGAGYVIISQGATYAVVFGGLVIAGFGLGLLLPNMNVWLNAIAPATIRGKALGGLTTSMFLGQFCSPILLQPVANRVGLKSAYGLVGMLLIGLAVGTVGLVLWSRKQQAQAP